MRVLVTGASGYVGGRLVPEVLSRGHVVRCLVRTPRKLDAAPWRDRVEVVAGDLDGDLRDALDDVDAAVYLVHSIGDGPGWAARERAHARTFRVACERAGVRRIVYLGGLGDDATALSEHLRSRHDVGRELAAGPIPVTELRAAMIIGSGSASFEMLRYLTEVLPVMVTPKWVRTRSQPIAVSDVLAYLVAAIERPEPVAEIVEIGGPDVVSYAELMAIYAREAGLRTRRLVPVPVLSPRLSSLWVGLVTPVPSGLARPLVESLVNPVVVRNDRAQELFAIARVPVAESVRRAIGHTEEGLVPTSFSDAAYSVWDRAATDPEWSGGTELRDTRAAVVDRPADAVWQAVCRVGGARGWYGSDWLWRIRGVLDQLVGGPGLRRGRRHPDRLAVGEPLDFWRVEELDAPRLLRLHAEMRLPGEAWLEWRIEALPDGTATRVVQTARYRPRGLLGRAYWYAVAPFHRFVFPALLRGIVADAEASFGARLDTTLLWSARRGVEQSGSSSGS